MTQTTDKRRGARGAAVFTLVLTVTAIAVVALITLLISGAANIHPATIFAVLFGGVIGAVVAGVTVTRKPRPRRGRARNLTDHTTSHTILTTKETR